MASVECRFDDNVPGALYVDSNCIACDTCVGIAPGLFKLTDDFDHAVVTKQPVHDVEFKRCQEAMACCPVNAIGDDGAQ